MNPKLRIVLVATGASLCAHSLALPVLASMTGYVAPPEPFRLTVVAMVSDIKFHTTACPPPFGSNRTKKPPTMCGTFVPLRDASVKASPIFDPIPKPQPDIDALGLADDSFGAFSGEIGQRDDRNEARGASSPVR